MPAQSGKEGGASRGRDRSARRPSACIATARPLHSVPALKSLAQVMSATPRTRYVTRTRRRQRGRGLGDVGRSQALVRGGATIGLLMSESSSDLRASIRRARDRRLHALEVTWRRGERFPLLVRSEPDGATAQTLAFAFAVTGAAGIGEPRRRVAVATTSDFAALSDAEQHLRSTKEPSPSAARYALRRVTVTECIEKPARLRGASGTLH